MYFGVWVMKFSIFEFGSIDFSVFLNYSSLLNMNLLRIILKYQDKSPLEEAPQQKISRKS